MNQKPTALFLHSSVTPQIEKIAIEMREEFLLSGHQIDITNDLSGFSDAELAAYEMVCIGTEEGNDDLSQVSRLFDHPQVIALASCRRSLHKLKKKAEKHNFQFSDQALFTIKKGIFSSLNSWLTYQKHARSNPDFEGFKMYPFGISDAEMERIRDFAKRLIPQLTQQSQAELVYS